MSRLWQVRVAGAESMPHEGPVIVAANHTAFLDGVLLAGASSRPVHLLTPKQVFAPPLGRLLRAVSQIPSETDGPDRLALRTALGVLEGGGVIGIFPEGGRGGGDVSHVRHSVAYLAARSGAAVVPVAILGARPAGAGKDALPSRRSSIDVVFGEPVDIRVEGDPNRRAVLARSGERLRQTLADHVHQACLRTGHELPGPLPDPIPDARSSA